MATGFIFWWAMLMLELLSSVYTVQSKDETQTSVYTVRSSQDEPPLYVVKSYEEQQTTELLEAETISQNSKMLVKHNLHTCRLKPVDNNMNNRILELIAWQVKLIEYNLAFPNYSQSPLEVNNTVSYNPSRWARAYSQHGQTLLSLAFNYGVLSLMTLTLGVEALDVDLYDEPKDCMMLLSHNEKMAAVMFLLMRDFKSESTEVTFTKDERICHETLFVNGKHAKFTDKCCFMDPIQEEIDCTTDIINIWLKLLFFLLASVKFALLFFGPIWFVPIVDSMSDLKVPYVVKLRDVLIKTIMLCKSDTKRTQSYDKVLDLRNKPPMPKFVESFKALKVGEPTKVKFERYDILVTYKRLLSENDVPVGLMNIFYEAFCKCRIEDVGPFESCCKANAYGSNNSTSGVQITWIQIFKSIAKVLFLLLLPAPFYLRLFIFYQFEWLEIQKRQSIIAARGLLSPYEGSIMAHLTPTHPIYIIIYILYFMTPIILYFIARGPRKQRLLKITIGAFKDLETLSVIKFTSVVIGNFIYPFKKFGIIGFIFAPLYWLIVIPPTICIFLCYAVPAFYIPMRMVYYTLNRHLYRRMDRPKMYKIELQRDMTIYNFTIEAVLERWFGKDDDDTIPEKVIAAEIAKTVREKRPHINMWTHETCEDLSMAMLTTITLFGCLLIVAECVGFFVEIGVFTLMGIIVNAGTVLKYVTLLILVVVYSYDCYNNVSKKYLKLNKSLFGEVKGRCKEVEKVTSLPSHLQENHGFKSQELSEQADYEDSDGLSEDKSYHWMINDLVLFVDSEDMPRIPRNLFEEVCNIRVAGAPGPVFESMLDATKEFFKILGFIFFVFVVVLTFGQAYRVSSTNQMLATMAGGFLPLIMRTFLAPSRPDIELGTVSFKSKLDEIIKNFRQNWPIYDLPISVWTEEHKKETVVGVVGPNQETVTTEAPVEQATHSNNLGQGLLFMDAMSHETFLSTTGEIPGAHTTPCPQPQANNTIKQQTSITASIGNEKVEVAKKSKFDVDILIYIPDDDFKANDWLDEWSDLNDNADSDDDLQDVKNNNGMVLPANDEYIKLQMI